VRQVIVGQVQSTEPGRFQDALWEDRQLVALLGTLMGFYGDLMGFYGDSMGY